MTKKNQLENCKRILAETVNGTASELDHDWLIHKMQNHYAWWDYFKEKDKVTVGWENNRLYGQPQFLFIFKDIIKNFSYNRAIKANPKVGKVKQAFRILVGSYICKFNAGIEEHVDHKILFEDMIKAFMLIYEYDFEYLFEEVRGIDIEEGFKDKTINDRWIRFHAYFSFCEVISAHDNLTKPQLNNMSDQDYKSLSHRQSKMVGKYYYRLGMTPAFDILYPNLIDPLLRTALWDLMMWSEKASDV